jgi:hypothetical protein
MALIVVWGMSMWKGFGADMFHLSLAAAATLHRRGGKKKGGRQRFGAPFSVLRR